jgi:hypothetical protein
VFHLTRLWRLENGRVFNHFRYLLILESWVELLFFGFGQVPQLRYTKLILGFKLQAIKGTYLLVQRSPRISRFVQELKSL